MVETTDKPKVNSKQLEKLITAMKKVCQTKIMDASFVNMVEEMRQAGKEYDAFVSKENKPSHFHKKSGKEYKLLIEGKLESTSIPVVVYQDAVGDVWVRPKTEWDSNFSALLPIDLLEVKQTIVNKFEAVQYSGLLEQAERIKDWIGDSATVTWTENVGFKTVKDGKNVNTYRLTFTLPNTHGKIVNQNDWILKHSDGTFEAVSNYDFGNKGYSPSNPTVKR